MKKLMILIPLFLIICSANGQNGDLFLSFKGGYGINRIGYAGFSFEFPTEGFTQNEIFADFQENKKSGYQTALAGFGIKPVLVRYTNTAFRLMFGAAIGSDFERFIAAPHVGCEVSQAVRSRIELFLGNKNQVILWSPTSERWRFMAFAGIRFPLI
ncbi:MAG: hypothetical protein KGZ90_08910 [Algoriphagus sp.]|nr:hypothetical protein [Algoriphagus sp.]